MLLQSAVITALSPQLFKDPECWSGWGLNLRPHAQQTGTLPTELTGRRRIKPFIALPTRSSILYASHCLIGSQGN